MTNLKKFAGYSIR